MRPWCWLLLWLLPGSLMASDTALIDAAARGDVATLRTLLDGGAAVNARDARGRNAVLAATQGGHVEAARLLIARGADVNAQNDIRDSAFLLAGARGHTEIVRLALAAGADLRLTNRYGATALIPACHYVIPLGTTINMAGTALYQAVATLFLAQVYQVDVSLGGLVLIVVLAVGASIGSPGTPGIGIPASGIALIIGVDRILDMCRTAVNVTGDLIACTVLDAASGQTTAGVEPAADHGRAR